MKSANGVFDPTGSYSRTRIADEPVEKVRDVSLCSMSDTVKSTIISRVDDLGEAAITSWGEQASIRVLRVDNDNNFCILDYRAPARFGPPRHLHYVQDEVLEILKGSVAVWTPDWCGVLHAGDIVSLPSGVPHAWRSIDDQAVHFPVIVTPGAADSKSSSQRLRSGTHHCRCHRACCCG